MSPIVDLVKRLLAVGASADAIAISLEVTEKLFAIIENRKEKDRARKASARAGIKGGSKENPGMSAEIPQIVRGHSEDMGGDISSLTSTFLLVDQPLKEGSKKVRSELVALDARDVSRVISDDWPDDYEAQFWAAYPRKIGRKAARTKLRTIRQRREVTFAALMFGVSKIPIGEAKFTPHPTTWLNRGGWEDEHEKSNGATDGRQGNILPELANALEFIRNLDSEPGISGGTGKLDDRLLPEGGRERSQDLRLSDYRDPQRISGGRN